MTEKAAATRTGPGETAVPQRRFWLCADDYGIAPGVNAAICDLIANRRLNATSVMTVGGHLDAEAVAAVAKLRQQSGAALGLHVTLTGLFAPRTAGFVPRAISATQIQQHFPPLGRMLALALAQQLNAPAMRAEIEAQFAAFETLFGFAPDFVDGHQHVHLFPQVRDVVLDVTKRRASHAWVRQCGNANGLWAQINDPKGLLIAVLSRSFRRRAAACGIATNPAFAGTYAFAGDVDFAGLFPRFLAGLPDGGLVMCHPGTVDAALVAVDPLTTPREREYAYLAGGRFPKDLAAAGLRLF